MFRPLLHCRLRLAIAAAMGLVCIAHSGCGCNRLPQTPEEIRQALEDLEENQRTPAFEVERLVSSPYEAKPEPPFGPIDEPCWCKPGHWTTVALPLKSNKDDVSGRLAVAAVDKQGRPGELFGSGHTLGTARPAVLPRGQWRTLDAPAFFSPGGDESRMLTRLLGRGGQALVEAWHPIHRMPAYQYHLAVLARYPDRYGYLKQLDALKCPLNLDADQPLAALYRPVLLPGTKAAAFPPGALAWTSTAAVIWDEVDPSVLPVEQQTALVDWLHFGGRLIISGPDTLSRLSGSFLQPYLPGVSKGPRELRRDDLAPLSAWSPEGSPLVPARPWNGVRIELAGQGRFIPGTGNLLAERRLGRGHLLVTAFPLAQSELVAWPGFDGFFHACLLGRPPRSFAKDGEGTVATIDGTSALDPRLASGVRYLARDSGRTGVGLPTTIGREGWFYSEEGRPALGSGVAGWSDFNPVADAARRTLRDAARIETPDRSIVFWVLGGYLAALIPLNYLVFRLLGRLEWAWFAAPVIAVAGVVVVLRVARVDLGFDRAAIEVAVVEIQAGYSRGHVARYTAVYNSLGNDYRVTLDDPAGQLLPFPAGEPGTEPTFDRGAISFVAESETVGIEAYRVASNSTRLLHAEQMIDLGGQLTLRRTGDRWTLHNGTGHVLRGAGVVRSGSEGTFEQATIAELAWLGDLPAGASAEIAFQAAADTREQWTAARNASPQTAERSDAEGELNLARLLAAAESAMLAPGETRLVAWIDGGLPGQSIEPAASRTESAAIVVVHLDWPADRAPKPDLNVRPPRPENGAE